MNSIDDDITSTLNKLAVLLQYSASAKSDGIYQLIARAKAIWESDEELLDEWDRSE